MLDLSGLNENQRLAVEWTDGPLLVLAGPGSGKTRVLTYRIASLLERSPDQRFRILGITFTNKAAAEMRTRLDTLVTQGRERALLTTFHSFAAEILRQHGSHVGLRPDFTILSQQADREAVLTEAIATVSDPQEGTFTAERLLPAIDRLLDEGIAPDNAEQWLKAIPNAALVAKAYRQYVSAMLSANQLDFGCLIVVAVDLLRKKPVVAKQLRRIYRYVCVDEFQDTNASQYALLLELVPPTTPNLVVVADDDQVIYQWNGANPKRLQQIRDLFGMTTVQLPENYRCPMEVIDLANRLIRHNDDRAPDKKALITSRHPSTDQVVRLQQCDDLDSEVAWMRDDILQRPDNERPHCAVLARTRKLLEAVVQDFTSHCLPAYIAVRKTEFQSAPLRWLHATLRLANARQDREQLRRLCKAFYSLEGANFRVEDLVAQAVGYEGDFLRTWLGAALNHEGLAGSTVRVLGHSKATLLERSDHWSFIDAAFTWFEELKNQTASLPEGAFDEYDDEARTWQMLQQEIMSELGRSEATLHALLQGMDLRSKEPPAPKNAIRCLTIHTAKGLEFRHVYLMGLAEDQLPSWAAVKKGSSSHEMREERRNCFVAITRAEQSLTLSFADRYSGWQKKPSRFLFEMGLLTA